MIVSGYDVWKTGLKSHDAIQNVQAASSANAQLALEERQTFNDPLVVNSKNMSSCIGLSQKRSGSLVDVNSEGIQCLCQDQSYIYCITLVRKFGQIVMLTSSNKACTSCSEEARGI